MKTVYLHVGFDKAGSSSIQASIFKSKEYLNSIGFVYPEFGESANLSFRMHLLFSKHSNTHPHILRNGFDLHKIKRINKTLNNKIDKCIETNDNVIISAESISLLKRNELLNCREYFLQKGVKLKVIAFVRNPTKMLASGISQRIKSGIFINRNNMQIFRSKFVKNIKSVFKEEANFTLFSKACKHENGPVGEFFRELGIINQDCLVIERENVSPSNLGCRLINHINKFDFQNNSSQILNDNYDKFAKEVLNIGGEKFKLSKQEIYPIINKLNEENSIIEELLELDTPLKYVELDDFEDQHSEAFYDYSPSAIQKISNVITNSEPILKAVILNYYLQHDFIPNHIRKQISNIIYKNSEYIHSII